MMIVSNAAPMLAPHLLPRHASLLGRRVFVKVPASRALAVVSSADIARGMIVSSVALMPVPHPLQQHVPPRERQVSVRVPAWRVRAVVLSVGTVLGIVVFVSLSSTFSFLGLGWSHGSLRKGHIVLQLKTYPRIETLTPRQNAAPMLQPQQQQQLAEVAVR